MALVAIVLTNSPGSAADVFAMPEGLTSVELVEVGQAGNVADAGGRGAVAYAFRIGRYEVTAAQWVEFLNQKAHNEADGALWNNDMDSVLSGPGPRSGARGRRAATVTRSTPRMPTAPSPT
jgi:formylglycine-generating enzyme required for sulfatase activity